MTAQEKITYGVWIGVITLAMQVGGIVVAGTWLASQITATTEQLQVSIGSLTGAVTDLNKTVTAMQIKQSDHEWRLNQIERRD